MRHTSARRVAFAVATIALDSRDDLRAVASKWTKDFSMWGTHGALNLRFVIFPSLVTHAD